MDPFADGGPADPPIAEHSPAFDGAKAIVLMPILYHVEPEMFESAWLAASYFSRAQLRFMAETKTCVWKSRERLVHRFLQTDAKYAIMLDHDMLVTIGVEKYISEKIREKVDPRYERLNFFQRLLSYPENIGIVGGWYRDRITGNEIMCDGGCGPQRDLRFIARLREGELHGLVPRFWVATGGMRIARWVFEQMAAVAKDKFPEIVPKKEGGRYGFFTPNHVDIGEDVVFCARARSIGIQSYLDADLRLWHKGDRFF